MRQRRKLATVGLALMAGTILSAGSCADKIGRTSTGDRIQGWNTEQRLSWYQGTQGSRLMPRAWAAALERADSGDKFFTEANLVRYRFLPLPESASGLPVGFAVDNQSDDKLTFTKLRWYEGQQDREEWIGLNCSACHTGQVSYQGTTRTIDGGPSLVDFQTFIEEADAALAATRSDPAKWDRFAAAVLDGRDTPDNRTKLQEAVDSLVEWNQQNADLNATPLRYGYGRLDAFGHIFNKVAQLAVYGTDDIATENPADAPVSYPFLWDIYRHDKLQWNGIVEAERLKIGGGYLDYGALGRNTGEVIGVFGDVDIQSPAPLTGYRSSIQADNLNRLESVLRQLEPPEWPEEFPAVNPQLVEAGRTLYQSKGCQGCHTIEPAGNSIYQVRMVPLSRNSQGVVNRNNTDPWMACNAISYTSATGKLEGTKSGYIRGEPLGDDAQLANMLSTSVIGTLVGKLRQIAGTAVDIFFGVDPLPRVVGAADAVDEEEARAARLNACYEAKSPLFAYKARPLDGIWATAPYLHNGSVPTLYDLLLPAAQRPASFNVGTREFDPAKVGYRTDPAAPGNAFAFTASGPGNSNEGHDYNVGNLTEQERLALLEFMKTL